MCTTSGRGAWSDKIYHFDPNLPPSSAGNEIHTEFFILLENLIPCLELLHQVAPDIKEYIQIMEFRPVRADNFLMSPAYQKHVIGVHFTWFRDPANVLKSVEIVQKQLRQLIVGVHWGKLFTFGKTELRRIYGDRIRRFKQIRRRMDPHAKFVNSYYIEKFGLEIEQKL